MPPWPFPSPRSPEPAPRAGIPYTLAAGDLSATVRRKAIRTLRLSLRPPDGALHVSAPLRATDASILSFILDHREWVLRRRRALPPPVSPPQYRDGEALTVWGARWILRVRAGGSRARAEAAVDGILDLRVPEAAPQGIRAAAVERWYARELVGAALRLAPGLREALGVDAARIRVRAMRTRWGSCAIRTRTITLALELARRPPEALEYILTHEWAHLLVRTHGPRFRAILDRRMPDWRLRRSRLNRAPDAPAGAGAEAAPAVPGAFR